MKRCPTCRLVKPVADFSRHKGRADGLEGRCRPCHTAGVRASQKRYPERDRARHRRWNAANREKSRATTAAYRNAHPEKARDHNREHNIKRDHVKRGLPSERISRLRIYERDRGRCQICHKRVLLAEMTLDHIVPLSLGGGYTYVNLQAAHFSCNSSRGAGRLPAQMRLT